MTTIEIIYGVLIAALLAAVAHLWIAIKYMCDFLESASRETGKPAPPLAEKVDGAR